MAKWSGVSILAVLKWIIAQEHWPELVPDKVTVAELDKGSSSSKKAQTLGLEGLLIVIQGPGARGHDLVTSRCLSGHLDHRKREINYTNNRQAYGI